MSPHTSPKTTITPSPKRKPSASTPRTSASATTTGAKKGERTRYTRFYVLKPEDLDNEVLIADIEAVPTVRRTDTDLRRIRQNSNSVDAGTSAGAAEETTHGEPTDAH